MRRRAVLMVDGETVHRVCDWTGLADALFAAHRGPMPLVDRAAIDSAAAGRGTQSYLNIAAWLPGRAMASKLITILPDNPERDAGLPAIQALVAVFDGDTGSPSAVIDGTALTYRKTAADSALGSRLLSRPDAGTMTMIGAGGLAPYLVAAHRAVRPGLGRVFVWNRRREKADRLAASLRGQGIEAEAVADAEPAIRQSDIVSCATSSTAPVVHGAWLKPGAHLDLVGAYTPGMRECDDAAVTRARLFADSRMLAVERIGDLGDPIRRGVIRPNDVEADLFEMAAAGYHFDRGERDITLFKNGGGPHLDLFTALHIVECLAEKA